MPEPADAGRTLDVPRVVVRLPAVLALLVDGERRIDVRGATIGQVLDDLVRARPALGVHLFDESGALRRHVRCFHNDEYAGGDDAIARQVRDGESISILNAVSGG